MRPDSATYLRPTLSSSSTKVPVLFSPAWVRNSVRTREPPSVLKVRRSRSVSTVIFSPAAAGAAAGPGGALLPGTAEALAAGVAAGVALGDGTLEAPAGAGAVAAGLPDGKKVALLPLWTCHWSHSKTMEKPKITHKMVRRMSFMKTSSWIEERAGASANAAWRVNRAPDHGRPRTRDGSAPGVRASGKCRLRRHGAPAPAANKRNSS